MPEHSIALLGVMSARNESEGGGVLAFYDFSMCRMTRIP